MHLSLFDHSFDIMFLRVLKEISMGMYALHLSMAYRNNIIQLYQELTQITQSYYNEFTQYLLAEGILARPTYVSVPKTVDLSQTKVI